SASAMETFGMAVHEARAHGLPVLALDGGYVRNAFSDGEDGVLCSSIAELAGTLVELSRDEPAMKSLFDRAQASRRATRTWTTAAKEFLTELGRLSA
ncbi:MAG TPA: glycosyltransferase, partial [Polyangiaceae bacterium]